MNTSFIRLLYYTNLIGRKEGVGFGKGRRWIVQIQVQELLIAALAVLFGSEDETGRGGLVKYSALMSFLLLTSCLHDLELLSNFLGGKTPVCEFNFTILFLPSL